MITWINIISPCALKNTVPQYKSNSHGEAEEAPLAFYPLSGWALSSNTEEGG